MTHTLDLIWGGNRVLRGLHLGFLGVCAIALFIVISIFVHSEITLTIFTCRHRLQAEPHQLCHVFCVITVLAIFFYFVAYDSKSRLLHTYIIETTAPKKNEETSDKGIFGN